ncbi:MAG: hypothetical protein ACR2N4_05265 [Jatrophihabitans sp.]
MRPATATTGLGFWMNLPEGWWPLELSRGRIPEQVRRLLDERAAADPQVAAHRGQVEQQLRAPLRSPRAKELTFGAILATFTGTGLPIAASLALTRHRSPDGADAARILAELGHQSGRRNSLFELPFVGTVVRSDYLDRTPLESSGGGVGKPGTPPLVEVAVFQYYIPMPGGAEIMLATGASPTLPMRAAFGELFDAIISTFQFVDAPSDEI